MQEPIQEQSQLLMASAGSTYFWAGDSLNSPHCSIWREHAAAVKPTNSRVAMKDQKGAVWERVGVAPDRAGGDECMLANAASCARCLAGWLYCRLQKDS